MLRTAQRRLAGTASALLLLASGAIAQDTEGLLADGIQAYRAGDLAGAVEAFKDALAQNPGNEEVFRFWQQAEQDVLARMLIERGELGALAQRVLGLAKVGRKVVLSDPGGARDLVEQYMDGDAVESYRALLQLVNDYGEWAVPALVGPMADRSDGDRRVEAIKALVRLGDRAVPGLIQALKSDDETTRSNAAATLGSIGDVRAAAALAWAASSDDSQVTRGVASEALGKLGEDLAAIGLRTEDPETLTAGLAKRWLTGSADVVKVYSGGRVAWSWDGGLQGEPILAGLYHLKMAETALEDALALGAGGAVRSTLAAVHASMKAEILAAADLDGLDGELVDAARDSLGDLDLALAAAGSHRGAALSMLLDNGQMPAAETLIASMGRSQAEQAALRQALNNGHGGVSTAAALTLGRQGHSNPAVVKRLGDALTSVPERLVLAIGETDLGDGGGGWRVLHAAHVADGLARAKSFPPKDVVVLAEGTDGVTLDAMIFGLANDPRTANTPVVVLTTDPDGVSARYDDQVALITAELGLADVVGVAGADDARREAARARAAEAADVLARLPSQAVASASAQAAAALNGGDDAVRIAVLGLVGHAGMADALDAVEAILLEGGSDELMTAAFAAAADLWAQHGGARGDAAALREAIDAGMASGGDLAMAAARALGHMGETGGAMG